MRVNTLGLLILNAVLVVGLTASPGPAQYRRMPSRAPAIGHASLPRGAPPARSVAPGRSFAPRPAVPPRTTYTTPYRSPTARPTIPPGYRFPGSAYRYPSSGYRYPGYYGPRIGTVNRGTRFVAGVNRFNRPWWRHHYGWYYGAWYNWPAYPAFWANLPGAYWLSPWWTGSTFVYENPYYLYVLYPTENPYILGVPRGLDYSQPLPVPTEAQENRTESATVNEAMACLERGRVYFKAGRYADATSEMDRAVTLLPGDRSMQEFRALTLFARGEYEAASSAIYSVLAAGPGWNWETMTGLYPDVQTYTAHLRLLEAYARAHPTEGSPHFLLGYHYLVMNEFNAAIDQLRAAAKLSPSDKVSPAIVDALSR